jgi:hypothetical protein
VLFSSFSFFFNKKKELSYNPSPWASEPEPAPKKRVEPRAFPRTTFVLFDAVGNLSGLIKRAVELGASGDAVTALTQSLQTGKAVQGSDLVLVASLANLQPGNRVPGLDLLRLLALNLTGSSILGSQYETACWGHVQTALANGVGPERMLALRFFVNCVRHDPLRARLVAELSMLLDRFADVVSAAPHTTGELNALALLVGNLAVLNPSDQEQKTQLAVICGELLGVCQGADLLAVVSALGTLAVADKACKELIPDLDMTAKLQAIPAGTPAKVAAEQLVALVSKK